MRNWVIMALAAGGLASCAQFPELDQSADASLQSRGYPRLLPYDQLQAASATPAAADPAPALSAAAEVLRRRAAAQQAQN